MSKTTNRTYTIELRHDLQELTGLPGTHYKKGTKIELSEESKDKLFKGDKIKLGRIAGHGVYASYEYGFDDLTDTMVEHETTVTETTIGIK